MKRLSCIFLCLALFALVSIGGEAYSAAFTSEGTIFFLVHPGGPLKLEITLTRGTPDYRGNPILKTSPNALFSIFNQDEKLLAMEYWRPAPGEKEKKYTFEYPEATKGIWQIRNAFAQNCNLSIRLKTTPELKYGVLFPRCRILSQDAHTIRNSFFIVPPPTTPLNLKQPTPNDPQKTEQRLHIAVRGRQTECRTSTGEKITDCDIYEIAGAMPDLPCNAMIELPFGAQERQHYTGMPSARIRDGKKQTLLTLQADSSAVLTLKEQEVYQLLVDNAKEGYLAIDGFPVIFCPDAETAKAIGGSMVKANDGRHFHHLFQVKMHEWIKSLSKEELEIQPVPLEKFKKEWLKDSRSRDLLQLFAYAPHLFKAMDTNPGSLTFGTSPLNLGDMTLLYTLDKPYNPYYGNKALMKRVFLYYFRKWLCLSESGAFHDDPSHPAYCGGMEWSGWEGMVFCADYMTLAMMAPIADKELLALWEEALRLPAHRFWSQRLNCENQSLHWPLKLYALNMASGNPLYKKMAQDYLADIANPALSRSMKTGYLLEAYGLDGTYIGISASLLAFAARFSGDDAALPVLRRMYELLCHTVVREPDGSMAAANGFGHRTLGSWLSPQYGAGVSLVDDRLEAAAVMSRRKAAVPLTEAELDRYAKVQVPDNIEEWCKVAGKNLTHYAMCTWPPIWFNSILPMGDKIQNARLPVEKASDFEKNFNDEFYARRKPGYYAFIYTGNYSWRWHYLETLTAPLTTSTKITNGEVFSSGSSEPWLPMQGLNIFWTPSFGIFASAHNWSIYSQNLLRVEREGKLVDFPACNSAIQHIDKDNVTLEHKSRFLNLNLKRQMEMREGGIRVCLSVGKATEIKPVTLIEQIPFQVKEDMTFSACKDVQQLKLPAEGVTLLKISRDNGSAIILRFSKPVSVRLGYTSRATFNDAKLRIRALEIAFSKDFAGNGAEDFSYEMTGVR
ncbi:MAG: hypothetical protein IJS08_01800 [Victivallales bacterium]|nr:hypothetical protein [Victivallales bacterium]